MIQLVSLSSLEISFISKANLMREIDSHLRNVILNQVRTMNNVQVVRCFSNTPLSDAFRCREGRNKREKERNKGRRKIDNNWDFE